MSVFFEIAYAAATNKLCLFTGTGFSKSITDGQAPSWQNLIKPLCDLTRNPAALKAALFPDDGKNPLSLEEAAQIISIELQKIDLSIHDEVAKKIKELKLKGDNSAISNFLANKSLTVLTTNYDNLFEELVTDKNSQSITPGFPIPRSQAKIEVIHIHGSIDSPLNMIVTSNDYFKFINTESYFSRKLSTVLHENTVVILGYSLGDTNLKSIISDYKDFSKHHVISSNLFFISKSIVNRHIKDYYSHCYGIRVIDNIEVHRFFEKLNLEMPNVEKHTTEKFDEGIKKILFEDIKFNNDFVSLENSFYATIAKIGEIGKSINDPLVVTVLGKLIATKAELTNQPGAWEQYEHMARWLIYLGSILELKGTSIEETYVNAVMNSMQNMKPPYHTGYSWNAYKSWDSGWSQIINSNRDIIQKYIKEKSTWSYALEIVARG